MINVNDIRTNLFGVVGLQQPYSPDYDILEAALIASSSGNYFDQYCAYVTVENLKETQPYKDISDADFNEWLTTAIKNSISKVIQRCFNNDLIESNVLYSNSHRKSTEISNDGDFVGYEISVSKRNERKSFINKLLLDFSGTGTFDILLFHDSQVSPIQTQSITIVNNSTQEVSVNWELSYTSGKYYLGYLTDGLVPKAFDRDYESSSIKNCFKSISFDTVKVTGHNTATLFDIDDVDYVSETFGLNFNISTYNDYTNDILNNKNMYSEVIGYQFAADMLGMMLASTRTTGVERIGKANILIELQGGFIGEDLPNVKGVEAKLKEAIKEITDNITAKPLIQKFTAQ